MTDAEIKNAAIYYQKEKLAQPEWHFDISSIFGSPSTKKAQEITAVQKAENQFTANLSTSEKNYYNKEQGDYIALTKDLMEREIRTEKRERFQKNITKLGVSLVGAVGVQAALPTLASALTKTPTVAIADIPAGATAVEAGLPASTITGAAAASGGGILQTIGSVGKAITGGISTLADVMPKAGALYGAVESLLGGEDQPVTTVTNNPSSPAPASSWPLLNVTTPLIPAGSTGGIVLTTPAAEGPNYMLYAGIAILAFILLKGH
jgi:hypothetical protein